MLALGLVEDAGIVDDPIRPIAEGALLHAGIALGLLNGREKLVVVG